MSDASPGFGDLSLEGGGQAVASNGRLVELAEAEMRLVASLLRAQGQPVRRTVLEMQAWGIWGTAGPGALVSAIERLRDNLAGAGSRVKIVATGEGGFGLTATS
jgi:DNA-binding response OmpR family regulator